MPRVGLNISLTKSDGSPNGHATDIIENMAAEGKTQATIAAAFRKTAKQFETILASNKGDNAYRLAWERGRADHEQSFADRMRNLFDGDMSEEEVEVLDAKGKPKLGKDGTPIMETVKVRSVTKAGVIAGIFYAKTQLGWKEARDGVSGQGQGGGVTIYLPGSLSREEYLKRQGISRPVDTRKGETIDDVTYKDVTVPALPPPKEGGEDA